jgi:hypothetical protein
MRKLLLYVSIALAVLQLNGQTTEKFSVQNGASPWTAQTGLNNTMPIYAQVKKNGVLFQPAGILLGVFKSGICYGFNGLTAGPGAIMLHNITMGCNNETESGFSYKVYDPTTASFYDVVETVAFANLQPVGKIYAPVQLNISGPSALYSTSESLFSVFPNPVESNYSITLESAESKPTKIELLNASGMLLNVLYENDVMDKQTLHFERDVNTKQGIYFVRIRIGEKTSTKMLIFR